MRIGIEVTYTGRLCLYSFWETNLFGIDVYTYCSLFRRYQKEENSYKAHADSLPMSSHQLTLVNLFKELFNLHNQKVPTELTSRIANLSIALLCEFVSDQ